MQVAHVSHVTLVYLCLIVCAYVYMYEYTKQIRGCDTNIIHRESVCVYGAVHVTSVYDTKAPFDGNMENENKNN